MVTTGVRHTKSLSVEGDTKSANEKCDCRGEHREPTDVDTKKMLVN